MDKQEMSLQSDEIRVIKALKAVKEHTGYGVMTVFVQFGQCIRIETTHSQLLVKPKTK